MNAQCNETGDHVWSYFGQQLKRYFMSCSFSGDGRFCISFKKLQLLQLGYCTWLYCQFSNISIYYSDLVSLDSATRTELFNVNTEGCDTHHNLFLSYFIGIILDHPPSLPLLCTWSIFFSRMSTESPVLLCL